MQPVRLLLLLLLRFCLAAFLLAEFSRELECIEDETHKRCVTCTCHSDGEDPMCFISRDTRNGEVIVRRGCIRPPTNQLVSPESQCSSGVNIVVRCCYGRNFCNNVSSPEQNYYNSSNASNSMADYIRNYTPSTEELHTVTPSLRKLECIEDETHKRCVTCTCHADGEDPMCFISRDTRNGEVIVRRGCIRPHLSQLISKKSQCSSGVNIVVSCCYGRNFCNNVSSPEQIYYNSSNASNSTAGYIGNHTSLNKTSDGRSSSIIRVVVVPVVVLTPVMLFLFLSVPLVSSMYKLLSRMRKRNANTPLSNSPLSRQPQAMCCSSNVYTVTSGSGSGQVHLILRTIGHSISLCDVIGEGRFGCVYTGIYQGELIAVKKFSSRDKQSWTRETEAYTLGSLRHENILTYIASDMISVDGTTELWLITQYHPNGSLYDYLGKCTLTSSETLDMATSIVRGLAYLHTHIRGVSHSKPAIAHRDLKSDNILVRRDMTCCLCDLGHSVIDDGMNKVRRPVDMQQGSRRYMAPEILDGTMDVLSFDAYLEVDMYAFGLVLWEIASRCDLETKSEMTSDYVPPFHTCVPADPSIEEMKKVVVLQKKHPVISESWLSDDMMLSFVGVMKECWCKKSKARPSSAYVKEKLLRCRNSYQNKKLLQ